MEKITLTAPIVPPSNPEYRIERLVLDWDASIVQVYLKGLNNEPRIVTYSGATALTMMTALNKINLTTRSLNQRIFDRLIADGFLSGIVAGTVP